MVRLGLCCVFVSEPIRFRRTTFAQLKHLPRPDQLARLASLCRANAEALHQALVYCSRHGIGCFRVNSQILPLKTHPVAGYGVSDLPGGAAIRDLFVRCGTFAQRHGLRLTLHPDQFVVLNSPREQVVAHSMAELRYQVEVAAWVNADVITLHAGGVYGNKHNALARLEQRLRALPAGERTRLCLENDDRSFTPADLLPVCRAVGIPMVYDVHHHRCLPDGSSVEETTAAACATWNREPVLHISSPRNGWQGADPRPHHEFIDPGDFPACWRRLAVTVEVEAKAKEKAVCALRRQLEAGGES